jgi:hypothetical protein
MSEIWQNRLDCVFVGLHSTAVVGNLFQCCFCNPNLTVHTSKQQNWMNWRATIFLNQTIGNPYRSLSGQIFMSKNCGRNTTLFPQLHRYSAFFYG